MNPISISGFKAYDLRGRIPAELNEDVAYRIGRAYAEFLKPKKVVVGRDIRLSSEELAKALEQGLLDSGVDVYDIGLCGTEVVYSRPSPRRWTAASWSRRATTRRTTTA
jgi:phosphomannomutase